MLKKVLSFVLAGALLTTSSLMTVPAALADEGDTTTYATEFYSSFEDGDNLSLIENTVYEVDGVKQAEGMGPWVAEASGVEVKGDFTSKVTKIDAPEASYASSAASNLLDGNLSTRYSPSSVTVPLEIVYTLSEAQVLGEYAVGTYYSYYDPTDWTISGSNDGGETWTELHTVSGYASEGYNGSAKNYKVNNETAYTQYKMTVTKTASSWGLYIADWLLGTGIQESGGEDIYSINTYRSSNPSNSDSPVSGGWNGSKALKVEGVDTGAGRSYAKNVIYENLNVKVEKDTQLEYAILPSYPTPKGNDFDFEWTSQYAALDVVFTDGTLLSELGAQDQYEHSIAAAEQGAGGHLYPKQWNIIRSYIGKVAEGKIIDKILVVFDKPEKESDEDRKAIVYFDDIRIRPVQEKTLDNVNSVVEFADTRVGTNDRSSANGYDGHSRGSQWPAVMLPNGFNYWVPCTTNSGPKMYEYYPGNKGITHFSISHEASLWLGDFGTFQFMPNVNVDAASASSTPSASSRQSKFNRDNEKANPDYYSVTFDEGTPASGVQVEMSPTDHAAIVRMTFPENSDNVNVVFDSVNASRNQYFKFYDDGSFGAMTTHYMTSNEGGQRYMYVYGKFDKVPTVTNVTNSAGADAIAGFAEGTTEVVMKIATSFISEEQAKKNLEMEIASDASLEDVKATATEAWEEILGRVEIEGATEEQLTEMYTFLYHTYFAPTLLSENTGTAEQPVWSYASQYHGTASAPEIKTGYKMYYNNGFWDTFRGSWSTYALLTPSYETELLNGIVQHFVDSDWIPRWVAPGGRDSMVGTSSDIIFGDAVQKGIEFDLETAYKASKKNATVYSPDAIKGGRVGMDTSIFTGYTDAGVDSTRGLSWCLDNYLNDYGIAKMAAALGKDADADYFTNRAQNFVNVFNPGKGGWFMGKRTNGAWRMNVDSLDPIDMGVSDYTETNAWAMAFTATQDYQGLANLYGGNERMAAKIDELFATNAYRTTKNWTTDFLNDFVYSKMGIYCHANQPGHHITYIYDYLGQPYKTQAYTREILDRVYVGTSNGQGFPGDADNGEMAAWYVMTSFGLCPITTGTNSYALTAPMHDKTVLHLETGDVTIIANNNSNENVYIQSMTIDGVPHDKAYITYDELVNAKEIVYEMGSEPSDWATGKDAVPPSITSIDDEEVPNPYSDFTKSGVTVVNAAPKATQTTEAAWTDADVNISGLFNNTSNGSVNFGSNAASVYYYFPTAKQAKMFTLTSAALENVPTSAKLYGSNDGAEWAQVGADDAIEFTWTRETLAFGVNAEEGYKYYRLDLAAENDIALAEVELLGNRTAILDCAKYVTKGAEDEIYVTDITTDYDITGLVFRNAYGDEIAPISSEAVKNADGTTTTTVEFAATEEPIYAYAKNESGYEITQSRKTINLIDIAAVVSVETDSDEYKVDDEVTFTVVTNNNVHRIGLANEAGKFIPEISSSYVDNGDGTLTWTIKTAFNTKGDRTISVYTANYGSLLKDSGFTASFKVDIAVSEGDDVVEVKGVTLAEKAAQVNEVFVMTVKTSTSATKVGIFSETGSALGKVSQSYVDKNGERVWTIALKIGTKGNRKLEVKATDKTGVWSEGQPVEVYIY